MTNDEVSVFRNEGSLHKQRSTPRMRRDSNRVYVLPACEYSISTRGESVHVPLLPPTHTQGSEQDVRYGTAKKHTRGQAGAIIPV